MHMTLAAGARLGPYEILAPIGQGGMGVVFHARDPRLDRQVAIKLLPLTLAADRQAQERLRREAMAAAALDHPYICKIFEIGEEGDAVFLVMEYVAGETLDRRLRNGRMPLPETLRFAAFLLPNRRGENLPRLLCCPDCPLGGHRAVRT
jgi:serine/threonine protein kinase